MKHITFYFDPISPYAYLAFEKLPEALMGHSCSVTYKPILFAALLKHHGQLGPAEIAPKRDWTYRQVLWQAHTHGVALQMPASHPFNPLGLLRLAVACSPDGLPNRYVCETIFRHAWLGGAQASDATRLEEVTALLKPGRDPQDPSVKAQLKAHTDEAVALVCLVFPRSLWTINSFGALMPCRCWRLIWRETSGLRQPGTRFQRSHRASNADVQK